MKLKNDLNQHIYIRVDADRVGDKIELYLLENDTENAQLVHNKVQSGIKKLEDLINTIDKSVILLKGCDDILFTIPLTKFTSKILINLQQTFYNNTGFTLSIGVGKAVYEANQNLRKAKLKGRNKVINTIL